MVTVRPNQAMANARAAFTRDIAAYNAARGRANGSQLLQGAQKLFDQRQQGTQQNSNDFWRPAANVLNALGAIGYGVEQGIGHNFDQMGDYLVNAKETQQKLTPLDLATKMASTVPGAIGAFGEGVGKAVSGRADELQTGSDLIENWTDTNNRLRQGRGYKNTDDNVNPWVKGIGGFALDVATDPTSFLPGGAIGSTAKGAVRGAVTAAREAGHVRQIAKIGKDGEALLDDAGRAITAPETNAAGQIVGQAGSVAKTLAMPKGAVKGGIQGFKDWVASGGQDAAGQAARKAAQKRVSDGTATAADIDILNFKKPNAIPAQQVDDLAAKREAVLTPAAAPAQKAAATEKLIQNADEVGMTGMHDKAADAISDLSENSLRQQVVAMAKDSPAAQAVAFAKPGSDSVKSTLRRMTYTVPVHSAPIQRAVSKLIPLDKAAAAPAKAAWHDTVSRLLGKPAARQLAKIEDPEEFAKAVDTYASARVQQAHTDEQRVSDILKQMQSPNRIYRRDDLKNVARMLGLAQEGERVQSYKSLFQGRGAQDALNEMVRAERQQQKAFVSAGIPDGEAIETLAGTVDPKKMQTAASQDLIAMAEEIGPERVNELNRMLGKGLNDALGDPKEFTLTGRIGRGGEPFKTNKAETKAVLTHVWEQHKNYAFFKKALNDALDKADALGLKGGERVAYIGERMEEAVNFLDLRLRSLGITPVSARLGQESMRFGTGKSTEYAFLGLSDIWKALGRDFLDPILFRGPGTQFPLTVLQDSARFALKEAGTEVSPDIPLGALIKNMKTQLRKGVGVGTAARDFYLGEGEPILANIASKLMEPHVLADLTEANIKNGAMARAVVGTQAQRMVGPVAESLQAMLKLPAGTNGSDIDAVMASSRDLTNAAAREGLEGTDAARLANWDLDLALAQNLDTGQMLLVKSAIGMDDAAVIGPRGKLNATDAARLTEEGAEVGGKRSDARKATMEHAHRATNTARADEVTSMKPQIDDISETVANDALDSGAEDTYFNALDAVRADLTMGLPNWMKVAYRGAERMSGGFGYKDLQPNEIAASMSTRKMTDTFRENVKGLVKTHGDENLRGAFTILQRANSNAEVDAILRAGQTTVHAAARDLWPVMKLIFDHSEHNLFRRVGYSSDYINGFLRKVGVPDDFWLNGNRQSWEVATQWKRWQFAPDQDPMKVMTDYVNAMNQASVAPTIAASFSSEFGHLSTTYGGALSKQEAIKQGWKKIDVKGETGLGRWVDPEQYYPPEMVRQLSMLDQYLSASKILDSDSGFDKIFRYLDPIVNMMKTSITLWRPGHHVTNIIGEGLMNGLAGVWSPKAYADALAVLKSGGFIEGEAHTGLNKLIRDSAPEGMQLRHSDRLGKGVWVNIGGKSTPLSYDSVYRLLDDAGVLIHHAQAEDLLNESMDLYKTGSKVQRGLQKAQRKFAPNWLGQASAQRDNVFRVAHAVDLLSKKSYRSVPDAMRQVAEQIHSFHPNMQTLSAVEQKYVRRLIYFYTWQRQALTRVLESFVDTPGRVTAASKAVYGLSVAGGADPQSWGEPMPNDERIPSYMQGNFNSFLFQGGLAPTDGGDSMLWSASLNAPQLDVIQSVFGGIQYDPSKNLGENVVSGGGQLAEGALLQNVTPVARIPAELATGHRFGSQSQIKDTGAYLLDQTGLSYPRKLGLLGPQSDDSQNPEEESGKQQAALINYLLGARLTNVTSPANAANARREQAEYYKRLMANQAGQ